MSAVTAGLQPDWVTRDLPACPSCGTHNVQVGGRIVGSRWFAGQHLDETLPGGRLHHCLECELAFRHPRPPQLWQDERYRAAAADNWQESAGGGRRDWAIARSWVTERFGGFAVDALDVGCASGGFLQSLPANVEPFGIEANHAAAILASQGGVRIVGDDFAALDRFHASFDVVVAMDVIEHVADPLVLLDRMARAVRPGGMVIVSTGNLHAPTWQLLGSRYWYCTIPEHVSFVHPRWCGRAGERVGLRLEGIERFAHDACAGLLRRLDEAARNLLFAAAPGWCAGLRRLGFGGIDVHDDESLAATPPMWLTARDHFIARFRRA